MAEPEHVVTVKQGRLRGCRVQNITGGSYLSFGGIPFAKPPVGNLRFKDPEPPEPWTDIRDAINEDRKCAQYDFALHTIDGNDDCLYLHVATNSLAGSRPVMVWIHGGAFLMGNGNSKTFGPDYLLKHDIVFVSLNYRVGIFGFLNVQHEAAPGNMGMKDQLAGLKWVKENIAQFGGDPNNVTIFGESAGSASVHYHMISPLSKGFFHKAIMQSGVARSSWARMGQTVEMARYFVKALGENITDPEEMVKFFRTVPARKLVEIQVRIFMGQEKTDTKFPFGPSIDDESPEPFLPSWAADAAADGSDIPSIIGYNADEGVALMSGLSDAKIAELKTNIEPIIPRDIRNRCNTSSKLSEIIKEIKEFYFPGEKMTPKQLCKYFGDTDFVAAIQETVEIQARRHIPTYLYRLSHAHPKCFANIMFGVEMEGTAHAEDLIYLFHMDAFHELNLLESNSIEQTISDRMVKMWTDFAKTGNPTPRIDDLITVIWKPATPGEKTYLDIDKELTVGVNPNNDVYEFWKRIDDLIAKQ